MRLVAACRHAIRIAAVQEAIPLMQHRIDGTLQIRKLEFQRQEVRLRLLFRIIQADIIPAKPEGFHGFGRFRQGAIKLSGHLRRQCLLPGLLPTVSAHCFESITNLKPAAFTFAAATAVMLAWLRSHKVRLLALFACVLAPLFLFGELAGEVRERQALAFDEAILRFMRHNAAPLADQLMLFFSIIGSGPWIATFDVLFCAILLGKRRWVDALFWSLATGGSALLNLLAKQSFARARPDLWQSIAPETSFSFPSGHAMQTMAVAAALIVLLWPSAARWPLLVLGTTFTLLVGTSRVYLGVHFPSDVLGGWSASLAWVIGLSFLFYRNATLRRF